MARPTHKPPLSAYLIVVLVAVAGVNGVWAIITR